MSTEYNPLDEHVRVFYSKLFFNVLLNMRAVQLGLFDTFLCETDDVATVARWHDAAPRCVTAIQQLIRDNK